MVIMRNRLAAKKVPISSPYRQLQLSFSVISSYSWDSGKRRIYRGHAERRRPGLNILLATHIYFFPVPNGEVIIQKIDTVYNQNIHTN